jgi:hypothetical protein
MDKIDNIYRWRTPRNYNDMQRFVGLVNYISNFLPNVMAYTGPLMSMTKDSAPFFWRPIHEKCFEMIKAICSKTPVIRPINYESDMPIWLVCDCPAGFMSKKFTSAQQHYSGKH